MLFPQNFTLCIETKF